DRVVATGGRLMVRSAGGSVYPLLRTSRLFDVSDPAVSYDGRRVAFAATVAPDSAWRIWTVGRDGAGLAPLTRTDRIMDLARFGAAAARFVRYDDFDPAWLPDGRIVFASTRYPQVAEEGEVLASNLFVVGATGAGSRESPRSATAPRSRASIRAPVRSCSPAGGATAFCRATRFRAASRPTARWRCRRLRSTCGRRWSSPRSVSLRCLSSVSLV